jgi:ribosomal-protein-alanine N-acetyltransferase
VTSEATGRASELVALPILTDRLRIRPMRLEDAAQLLAVYGDADAMRHLTPDVPTDVAQAEEWVRSKVELHARDAGLSLWTVELRDSGEVVGDVGLQHEDYGWGPEIGIGGRGSRAFWHQGYATEAALACLRAGFDAGIERIWAETGPANEPAQRLLERLGMRRVAQNSDGWPVYAVTRDELLAHHG